MDWAFIGAARAGHRYTTSMHQSKCTSPHDDVVNPLLSMGSCMYIPSSLSQKVLVCYCLLILNLFTGLLCFGAYICTLYDCSPASWMAVRNNRFSVQLLLLPGKYNAF